MVNFILKFVASIKSRTMTSIIKSLILFVLSVTPIEYNAQNSDSGQSIIVNVLNVKSNLGQVYIGLYNSEETFLKHLFKGQIVEIKENQCQVVFTNIPQGEYAISIYHDVNGNHKLDTNFLGVPKEAYAFSNNAKGFMGPPKWKDVKFKMESHTSYHDLKF